MGLYDLFFDLTRLEMRLWDHVDGALRAETDVPLGRFEALLVLQRLGPCRILDVSRELGLTVGGTSKLIDRLETGGLCARRPNPDDRRSSLLVLTEEARVVIDRGEAVVESTLQTHLGAHLSDEARRTLGAQLGSLRRAGRTART